MMPIFDKTQEIRTWRVKQKISPFVKTYSEASIFVHPISQYYKFISFIFHFFHIYISKKFTYIIYIRYKNKNKIFIKLTFAIIFSLH